MTAFYNYSEPFPAECRVFERLEEAVHPELAVRCFDYVLLDERHEQKPCRVASAISSASSAGASSVLAATSPPVS